MKVSVLVLALILAFVLAAWGGDALELNLKSALDRQDLAALNQAAAQTRSQASAAVSSSAAQYEAALAYSYAAEVAMELHDKRKSAEYAQTGIDFARRAEAADPSRAEYHRMLGELCGQVIPANPLMGALKYGQCAKDEVNKAIELDGHSAIAYVSRGVGNYYLPESMGGGPELAIQDFDKALSLDPKLADAYLWKGLALRRANHPAEARAAIEKALALDPSRVWARQELDKIPGR